MEHSPLQMARYSYQPKLPLILRSEMDEIEAVEGAETTSAADQDKIKALFSQTHSDRKKSHSRKERAKLRKRNKSLELFSQVVRLLADTMSYVDSMML